VTAIAHWNALLDALEACWCDPSIAAPEDVLRLMDERQKLLDDLQALDVTRVDEPARAGLRARLQTIVERDRAFAAATERWREELRQQATRIRDGRVAAAGYARAPESETMRLLRKA
jgi:hypothetical protein